MTQAGTTHTVERHPQPADAPSAALPATLPSSMRAVAQSVFGSPDVLALCDLAVPKPGPGEVLVRVHAAAGNPWDWHFMRGLPYIARLNGAGIRRPKHPVLGGDIAGEVVATGDGATRFALGDRVFGFIEFGGYAEYAVAPESLLAAMPENLGFERAAAVPLAAQTALQGLRDAGAIAAGDRVLVIGASGGVGTYAVQLAKRFGANVTAVTSGRNAALVRSIGADRTIDYTRDDVAAGPDRYDLVLQLAGTASASELRGILAPGGRLVMSSGASPNRFVGPMGRAIAGVILGKVKGQAIALLTAKWNAADLAFLAGLLEAGDLVPVIDRSYPLTGVADAIRYIESGRARGKVVVSVAQPVERGAAR
jgi:NADPH:quinone reductase-like Zn-dependent oxidoreductase